MRKAYQTDLSDAEWSFLEPHLPAPTAAGRPKMHSTREILYAIFYIVRGGCAWRLLPHDFPPWKTLYHYFRLWRLDGTWEKMHAALRKTSAGAPEEEPSAQRGHSGQPVDQDDRRRRRRAWLRWWEKVKGILSATYWSTRRDWCSKCGSTALK
jgi:transposase